MAVAFNLNDPEHLAEYGVQKLVHINDASFNDFNAKTTAEAIAEVAQKEGSSIHYYGCYR